MPTVDTMTPKELGKLFEIKGPPGPVPKFSFGGPFPVTTVNVTELQTRVEELERNMESMVALVEELLNERERFEATYWIESREGSVETNFKVIAV